MSFNSFNRPGTNSTALAAFLSSTFSNEWNYFEALNLKSNDVLEATHEQILSNPSDVADGVIKVEMKFGMSFFNMFDSLIVKYRDDNSIQLMFYTEMHQVAPIQSLYNQLKTNLGRGFVMDHKFSSFNDEGKIQSLAKGMYKSENDELIHVWNIGRFNFTLNYRVEPLRQLLFIVKMSPEKEIDLTPRNNGTILNILKHEIDTILDQQEIKAEPRLENNEVKFIDYTFQLDPPELDIFEEVRIRVFDKSRAINESIQTHITYYSKFEVDTSRTIVLCDKIASIYGKDNYGDSELQPHELDFLDDSDFWTGRSWLFNYAHGIQDLKDNTQSTLYGVTITADPNSDGLSLHILAYNKMKDYQTLMTPENL